MKAQILKIAGVKSEKEFYKKFPTEAAFMKKHGKELAKLKKAAVGDVIEYTDVAPTNNRKVIDGTELIQDVNKDVLSQFDQFKDRAYELGLDSMTTEDEKEDYEYKAKIDALYANALNKDDKKGPLGGLDIGSAIGAIGGLFGGGGGGATGSVEVGELEMLPIGKKGGKFKPHMMYDPKTKKSKKVMTYKEHLALKKKGWGHEVPKGQEGVEFEVPDGMIQDSAGNLRRANADGTDIAFGGKLADQLKSAPVIGDIVMGISKIKDQKDALKDLKQMSQVTGIARAAAMTKPEEIEREYVRPEDIQNTGEEFFPIYGVGTNVLAKHGRTMNMFDNPGFTPLTNLNQVKKFQEGGGVPWGKIIEAGGDLAYGPKAERDAGSNIGGGIGNAIGYAIGGPLGGAIGEFAGAGIGDLLDRNDSRQKRERSKIDDNIQDMTNMQIGPQIHAGYASHMKKGGKLPGPNNDYGMIGAPGPQILKTFDGKNLNNMLQKASRMPDTLKTGGSVAGNGNVKTLWGGDVSAVAYNPYAGGESLYFSGNSHENKDPKTGQTGIGVAYGPQSMATNQPVVEVENEPAQILNENGEENLVIYGDLKIPNEYVNEIGDPDAGGKKFKHYVNNLNDEEARINKQMGKAVVSAGESDNTKWGELERSTSEAIIQGGDMKLQDIANKKTILADLQEALNDTFNERGIDGNKFISKGEIEAVKDTEDYAKKGSKIPKAQGDGQQNTNPDQGLELNELPTIFKTEEEAIEAGYEFDEEAKKWRKIKAEKVEGADATGSDIGDMPEGQKYDDKTGLAGNVTEADYEKLVTENPWFDWENFDRRKKEDVKRFQKEFNKRNKDAGIDVSLSVDGIVGEETVSARFSPMQEAADPEYEYAEVEEEEITTETTTTVKPNTPFDANLLKRLFPREIDNDLDYNQILPEINAAANNQLDPVYAQSFQPRLRVPYDISLQDRRNQITGAYRAMSQNPAVQNNPALAAAMAAPMYDAINTTTAEEFRLNQAMKDNVYSGNLDTLNQARLTNMGIYDQQQQRQAQAVANTKETQQEIVKSISDKYQQNKLENRREKVLRELYPNFRFTEDLDLFNQGNAQFNIPGGGQTSPFGPYQTIFDWMTGGGIGGGQNNTTTDTTTIAESAYGTRLKPIKKKVKRNQKNSNILRQFKKQ